MTNIINNLPRVSPGLAQPPSNPLTPSQVEGESFGDLLANFVQGVDGLGAEAEAAKDAFLNGDPVDLHEVMILAEESGIAFDLLLELRNKLIEAYQELIRMPL